MAEAGYAGHLTTHYTAGVGAVQEPYDAMSHATAVGLWFAIGTPWGGQSEASNAQSSCPKGRHRG